MAIKNAQQLAAKIATKYNPDKLAPFPYENILEAHDDLSIVYTSLDDEKISGVILLKDDAYFILINTLKHTNRQNFTLGHEWGTISCTNTCSKKAATAWSTAMNT